MPLGFDSATKATRNTRTDKTRTAKPAAIHLMSLLMIGEPMLDSERAQLLDLIANGFRAWLGGECKLLSDAIGIGRTSLGCRLECRDYWLGIAYDELGAISYSEFARLVSKFQRAAWPNWQGDDHPVAPRYATAHEAALFRARKMADAKLPMEHEALRWLLNSSKRKALAPDVDS